MNRKLPLVICITLVVIFLSGAVDLLKSEKLTAKPMAGNYGSTKSNVIISEPVNCSSGRDLLGICAFHAQNFTGENITIAIIDYQFYVDRLSERELSRNRVMLLSDTFSENERHGAACAEIISEIAPNATLYMLEADSSKEGFLEAVDKLLFLNKQIDIVSCSLDFPFSFFDERNNFCGAVRNLTKKRDHLDQCGW